MTRAEDDAVMAGILLRLLDAGGAEMTWWLGKRVGGGSLTIDATHVVISPDERAALNRARVRTEADRLG
jgi:hypothetical protein